MNGSWKNLNTVLKRFVDEHTVFGCGIQIYHEGEFIYKQCYGSATADGKRPYKADTRLRLYSMTKNFTCAALMTLYDKGLFALKDPVAEYLPEFKDPVVCVSTSDISDVVPAKRPITIRHLLSMRSGIPYYPFFDDPAAGPVQRELWKAAQETERRHREGLENTLEDFVKRIAAVPLSFHPGDHWLYGLSHTVVGRLIEVLSGKSYGEYMKEAIWEPLGLTRTCFAKDLTQADEIAETKVSSELIGPFGLTPDPSAFPAGRSDAFGAKEDILPGPEFGFALPCGGISSTLEEVSRLYAMFADYGEYKGSRILARRTIDLMRENQLNEEQLREIAAEESNWGFGYGLGFRTFLSSKEAGMYLPKGSFGWDGASGNYGLASPDNRFAFVFSEQSLPHNIYYTIPRVVAAMNADMNL